MEPTIKKPYMFLPTAKKKNVWDALKATYSDIHKSSRFFFISNRDSGMTNRVRGM